MRKIFCMVKIFSEVICNTFSCDENWTTLKYLTSEIFYQRNFMIYSSSSRQLQSSSISVSVLSPHNLAPSALISSLHTHCDHRRHGYSLSMESAGIEARNFSTQSQTFHSMWSWSLAWDLVCLLFLRFLLLVHCIPIISFMSACSWSLFGFQFQVKKPLSISLTLGTHVHEGYCSLFVCVCVSVTTLALACDVCVTNWTY